MIPIEEFTDVTLEDEVLGEGILEEVFDDGDDFLY